MRQRLHLIFILAITLGLSSPSFANQCKPNLKTPVPLFSLTISPVQSGKCWEFSSLTPYNYIEKGEFPDRNIKILASNESTSHITICRDSKHSNLTEEIFSELYEENLISKRNGAFSELGYHIKRSIEGLDIEVSEPEYFINTHYNSCTNHYREIDKQQSKRLLKKYHRLIKILESYQNSDSQDHGLDDYIDFQNSF